MVANFTYFIEEKKSIVLEPKKKNSRGDLHSLNFCIPSLVRKWTKVNKKLRYSLLIHKNNLHEKFLHTHTHTHTHIYIYIYIYICPCCYGYCHRKWTWQHEFKSWTRLIAFHIALIPLGKVCIQLFSLQLWVNSRKD